MRSDITGRLRNGAVLGNPPEIEGVTKALREVDRRLPRFLADTLTGTLLCAWLALTAALVGQAWHSPTLLLVLFVPAVGVVARMWGFAGAMLGLISALYVLRVGLFVPIGRLEVASADARTGLFWMLLGASVVAYVFARPQGVETEIRSGGGAC